MPRRRSSRRQSKDACRAALVSSVSSTCRWPGRISSVRSDSRRRRRRKERSAREWNGKLDRVMILEEGFAWNGQTFGSLSQIAKAMTGTNWNGHRFFGLRQGKAAAPDKDRSRRNSRGRDTATAAGHGAPSGEARGQRGWRCAGNRGDRSRPHLCRLAYPQRTNPRRRTRLHSLIM